MNLAHLHLMVNHLPILGLFIGLILGVASLFLNNRSFQSTAMLLLFLACLSAMPAYYSGEGAEEIMEASGTNKVLLEDHEESAKIAFILMGITGFFAGITWFLQRDNPDRFKFGQHLSLTIGSIAFLVVSHTAFTGGKISHPEIRSEKFLRFLDPANSDD